MRNLLVALLLTSVLLILLEKAYDYLFTQNLNLKVSRVRADPPQANVVATGNSGVLYGIDPQELDRQGLRAYNLAENHSSFSENLAAFHLYLQRNRPPQYLLIGLSLPDLTLSGSTFHAWRFAPYLRDSLISGLVERKAPRYYFFSRIPFLSYAWHNEYANPAAWQGLYKTLLHPAPFSASGYYPAPVDPRGFEGYDTFKSSHPSGLPCRWSSEDAKELEELVRYASDKGIRVIVFEPPFLAEARSYFTGRDEAIQNIRNMLNKYDSEYWLSDTLALCRDRRNFVSAFHTSREAGAFFTRQLGQLLKK
jgi:hypothetical protein